MDNYKILRRFFLKYSIKAIAPILFVSYVLQVHVLKNWDHQWYVYNLSTDIVIFLLLLHIVISKMAILRSVNMQFLCYSLLILSVYNLLGGILDRSEKGQYFEIGFVLLLVWILATYIPKVQNYCIKTWLTVSKIILRLWGR